MTFVTSPPPVHSTPVDEAEVAYLEKGQTYLSSLLFSGDYFNSTATDGWEALLRKSASAWGEGSSGSVTGDYHLLEAMVSVGVV